MPAQFDIWKILTTAATAGLIAAFGWIIKVETEMVQLRSDLSDSEGLMRPSGKTSTRSRTMSRTSKTVSKREKLIMRVSSQTSRLS